MLRFAALLLLTASWTLRASADDWTQWRGPNGNNTAAAQPAVPTEWDENKNVVWKTSVPGRGHSSPIISGNMIILTSADEATQRQGVFAFDRTTGQSLWGTVISQGGFPKSHAKNTHASATACTDGQRIYATFCHHNSIEAVALDLKGKTIWQQPVGGFLPRQYEYGYAASPTLYGKTLIVSGDCDTVAWIKALDTQTGKIVWEQQRPQMLNWSSPIVANVSGREQLIISGCECIASYDPATGKPLWKHPCLTMATCGTVVWDDDTIYASGGYPKKETVAMKADGSGQILWTNGVKCYEQSMLIRDGSLYAVDDNGVAYCWEAKTGRERWKQRLQGPVSASPLLIDDTIYASNELGTTFIFKASPDRFTAISRNQLGTESFASPVAVDGILYLRVAAGQGTDRREMLFAIGSQSSKRNE
ncbi:MAG: PQQ-binding-like beta-propeller repeat protein [Planctomycetaceae bacterium]